MSILDVVSFVIQRDVIWVPLLLLFFNQILKISFSLLNLINRTMKEVFLTIGAELCVLSISIHLSILSNKEAVLTKFFAERGQNVSVASNVLLVIYMLFTSASLLFLKLANNVMETPRPVLPDPRKDRRAYMLRAFKIASLISLSIGIGVMLFAMVIQTV